MTKTILFAIAFISCVVISCQREIEDPSPEPADNTEGTVFRAVAEQGKTKTILSGTDILWYPGDKISLFCGSDDENHELSTSIIRPSATADFTTQITGLEPDYMAVYPYSKNHMRDGDNLWVYVPEVQYVEEETFAPDAFPCVARSSNQELRFYNVCAGLKFCLPHRGFSAVKIISNNGEAISGHIELAFDGDNHPYVEAVDGPSEIILLPPEPSIEFAPKVDYYVSIFPGILEDGLRIEVYAGFEQLFNVSTYNGRRELKRNVIANLEDFDAYPIEYLNQETVDLGLSVQWATCNLGAPAPEEPGFMFTWGEYEPKIRSAWYDYQLCDYDEHHLLKYNTDSDYGVVDGLTRLESDDDAATLYLGGDWRMPTPAEVQELIDGCNWSYDNVNFTLVGTSKVFPDRSIEIPMIGWDGEDFDSSLWATFWTSDINGSNPSKATRFATQRKGSKPSPSSDAADRYRTFPIRPVYGKEPEQTVEFVEHAPLYWYNDVDGDYNTVRCHTYIPNFWLPTNVPSDNDTVGFFTQNLNDFWKGGKVRLKVNGSIVPDDSDEYRIEYVFSRNQPYINGRKWTVNETGDVLYYQGEPVISLNTYGINGWITYEGSEDPDYISKVLLNYWSAFEYSADRMLYCNVDLVAYKEDKSGLVELARESMHVRFLRPVNFCSNKATFNHFGVPAYSVPIGDLFTARDWNRSVDPEGFLLFKKDASGYYRSCYYPDQDNQSTANVYWYNYYGFSHMSFNLEAVRTDITGTWENLTDVFPKATLWVAPADDIVDCTTFDPRDIDISDPYTLSDAVLAFYNSEAMTGSFNLSIPMSVEYVWGVFRDYAVVSVIP